MNPNQFNQSLLSSGRPSSRLFGQFIIKHHFQFKFSLILFGIMAVATLILWLESHIVVKHLIESGVVHNEEAIEQLKILSSIIGKSGFVILGITFGATLFLSHFVAGPLYRFEKVFQEIQSGNLALHVKLRKRDELQDVAQQFNNALSSLRSKIKSEREVVSLFIEKIQKQSAEIRKKGNNIEADLLDQSIKDLKESPPQIKIF